LQVQATQAGQIVSCDCGRQIEVPTLMKLRRLETVEDWSEGARESGWTLGHGLVMASGFVALLALAGTIYVIACRPTPPEEAAVAKRTEEQIMTMPLVNTFWEWDNLRRYGLHRKRIHNLEYQKDIKAYRLYLGATVAVMVLAVGATIVGGICVGKARRREETS
jgi:hypothetical protein